MDITSQHHDDLEWSDNGDHNCQI